MESVSQEVIDRFFKLTRFDIQTFFDDYVSFIETDYINIVSFFQGRSLNPNASSFGNLEDLTKRQKQIIDLFVLNASSFNTYEYWILLEAVEDVGSQLDTTNNLNKWLRSSSTKSGGGFVRKVEVDYSAKQGEDLEEISRNVSLSTDPDSWVDIAINNGLDEEDYSLDGGYLIKLNFQNQDNIQIQSVVSPISSISDSRGLDFDRKISFVDNNLKYLTGKETIVQSSEILLSLERGDNPAFPNDGIDTRNIVGNSLAAVVYPSIVRQVSDLFSKDDTFSSIAVTDISKEQDALFIDVDIKSVAGDLVQKKIRI